MFSRGAAQACHILTNCSHVYVRRGGVPWHQLFCSFVSARPKQYILGPGTQNPRLRDYGRLPDGRALKDNSQNLALPPRTLKPQCNGLNS